MLSSNMMPIMMPRSSSIFHQSPFPLGVYPQAIMFQPTHLYPTLTQSPAARSLLTHPWKAPIGYPPSSPPVQLQQTSSSPGMYATSKTSSPPPATPNTSAIYSPAVGHSPSPPCSPDSASSGGGEKTAFTIDAILSSKKRTPTSSLSGSPRGSAGFVSDRSRTPSPDLLAYSTAKSTSPVRLNVPISSRAVGISLVNRCEREDKAYGHVTIPHCGKLSTSLTRTNLGGHGDHQSPSSSETGRNIDRVSDKGIKRTHYEDGEWSPRAKRVRTIFTQAQLERLEVEFDRQQYMVGTERLYLAAELNLSESQVKVWFQNRRIKWRKQNFEKQQVQLAQFRAVQESHGGDRGSDGEEEAVVEEPIFHGFSDDTPVQTDESPSTTKSGTTTKAQAPRVISGDESRPRPSDRDEDESSSHARCAADLQLEMKKVEQRLAMRLCRRNMIQSTTSSSSSMSLLPSASHLRLISTIRRLESPHDVEYLSAAKRD